MTKPTWDYAAMVNNGYILFSFEESCEPQLYTIPWQANFFLQVESVYIQYIRRVESVYYQTITMYINNSIIS